MAMIRSSIFILDEDFETMINCSELAKYEDHTRLFSLVIIAAMCPKYLRRAF